MKPGPNNLITDVQGLLVGNAQNGDLKSGVTVLTADKPFVAAVDVMGGAPGTRETDLLEADKQVETVDALVLSGGSAFGLDAASGVMEFLREQGRGFEVGPVRVPLVPSAILFDLLNGGNKDWTDNPYGALGKEAVKNAIVDFELGTVGAGTGALTGLHKGGLGSASLVLESGLVVGALVATNAFGSVTTPGSEHLWAAPFEMNGEFGGAVVNPDTGMVSRPQSLKSAAFNPKGNTTIAIVATDALLTKAQAKRMAVAAQDGMARAIVPAHTPFDGDLVFAASTGEKPLAEPMIDTAEIGHAAALCLTRAIARSVYLARPAPGDILPCWNQSV